MSKRTAFKSTWPVLFRVAKKFYESGKSRFDGGVGWLRRSVGGAQSIKGCFPKSTCGTGWTTTTRKLALAVVLVVSANRHQETDDVVRSRLSCGLSFSFFICVESGQWC